MTISSATRKAGPFLGNGVTTVFPFSFKVFEVTDLQVTKTSTAGVDSVLTLNSDYSVALNADQNASPGGSITYPVSGTTLATGEKLTATGVLADLQSTHITNGGNFFANNIEDQMDYLTILVQQHSEKLARALLGSVSDSAPVLSLGTAVERASKYPTFDANGNVSLAQSLPSGTLSLASIAGFLYPQTSAESAVSVVPTNDAIPHHLTLGVALVERYGAVGDGATDDSAAFASAVSVAARAGCPIGMMAKTYVAAVSLRANSTGIVGPGSAVCTIKSPAGALAPGGVVELGNTALGNGAPNYDKLVVRGFTIDGNKANQTTVVDDLHGHGLCLTNITHFHISDIRAINCQNAGVGIFINSDYGYVDCYVENSGNATYTTAQFDINSSRYLDVHVVSNNAVNTGARVLDNCYGITGAITVNNAAVDGLVVNDQSVNNSYGLNLNVAVNGGCSSVGVLLGTNVHNSNFRITVNGVAGYGVEEAYAASNVCTGNTYSVSTYGGQAIGVLVGGIGGNWTINSYLDGRGGAAGSNWAVQVDGSQNNLTVNITDSAVAQVRGLTLTANSSNNKIVYNHNTTVQDYSDLGSANTYVPRILRGSASLAFGTVAVGTTQIGTVTVTGATTGNGDQAVACTSVNIGGVSLYAEVTAANTVTVWAVNETGAGQTIGTRTAYVTVTKNAP